MQRQNYVLRVGPGGMWHPPFGRDASGILLFEKTRELHHGQANDGRTTA